MSKPEEKKLLLRRLIEEETRLFARELSEQMAKLAFMCGVLNKTTDLAFQETDDKICCADVSLSGDQTIISKRKTLTIKDNKESERNEASTSYGSKKESPFPVEQSLNKASPPYTSIRYDLFSRGWAIDSQGAVHPCDINCNGNKSTSGYKKPVLNPFASEPLEKPMIHCRLRVTSLRQNDAHRHLQNQPRSQTIQL